MSELAAKRNMHVLASARISDASCARKQDEFYRAYQVISRSRHFARNYASIELKYIYDISQKRARYRSCVVA